MKKQFFVVGALFFLVIPLVFSDWVRPNAVNIINYNSSFTNTSVLFNFTDATHKNFTVTKNFTVNGLKNCDTIDTDANGIFTCGVDASSGGGGGTPVKGDNTYTYNSSSGGVTTIYWNKTYFNNSYHNIIYSYNDSWVIASVINSYPNLDTDSTDDLTNANVYSLIDTRVDNITIVRSYNLSWVINTILGTYPDIDTDSTDDFDGAYGSLTGVPSDIDTVSGDDLHNGTTVNVANIGTLDGYEASELLDDTTLSSIQVATIMNNISIIRNYNTSWIALNQLYGLNSSTIFGGEVSGTYNNVVVGNDVLDDQYYELTDKVGNTTSEVRSQFVSSANMTYDSSTGTYSMNITCLTITGSADLCDGDDSVGSPGGNTSVEVASMIDNITIVRSYNLSWVINTILGTYPNLDTDSTDDFDGAYGSLTGVPSDIDTVSGDDLHNGTTVNVANIGTLDGYEASELLDDTTLSSIQVATIMNNISIIRDYNTSWLTNNCVTITGSADLCDGSDDGSGGPSNINNTDVTIHLLNVTNTTKFNDDLEIYHQSKICLDGDTCNHYLFYNGTHTVMT